MIAIETAGVTIGFIVTTVVAIELVQPFSVIVKEYVPAIEDVALAIVGF